MDVAAWLASAADKVWSYPVVGLCLLTAAYFTLRLALIQFRAMPHAFALLRGKYDRPEETGAISHFQALSAALSGTIGIGNIAGVAIAIAVGGPGAVLWMWVVGLLGMATKFVSCVLGTAYRHVDPATGEVRGGPMYYIVAGLGDRWKPMAWFYAFTIAFAGFGFTCMFQSNQAASALEVHFGVPPWATGLALAVLTGAVTLGGITSIGRWAARIVPFMCVLYLAGAVGICVWQLDRLPAVMLLIVTDGFSGEAAAGGATGAMIMWGVRRAIFSNEAGLGSAAIAHAAVKTDEPVREGVVASLGPLIDTVVVCGATAFVIVLAGNYGATREQPVGKLAAVASTAHGWSPGDDAPAETDELREFVGNAEVMHYDGATESEALRFDLPDDTSEHDGVRVPFFRADHARGVVLRIESGESGESGESVIAESVIADDKACPSTGEWSACLVALDDEARSRITKETPLQLAIVPLDDRETNMWVAQPSVVDALTGISLSSASFDRFIPGFGSIFISIAGFLFALSTMITWSYYGTTASHWLFGQRAVNPYRVVFVALAFLGAVRKLDVVVSFSDLMVGLLVIPNTIAILVLSPKVVVWTRDYFARLRAGDFDV